MYCIYKARYCKIQHIQYIISNNNNNNNGNNADTKMYAVDPVLTTHKDGLYEDQQQQTANSISSNNTVLCEWVCVCIYRLNWPNDFWKLPKKKLHLHSITHTKTLLIRSRKFVITKRGENQKKRDFFALFLWSTIIVCMSEFVYTMLRIHGKLC